MAFVAPTNLQHDDFDWDNSREIGVGAIARIYLAKCLKDGKEYALKCVCKGALIHHNKVEAAMSEKTLLNKLEGNTNVARLYSTFQTEEELFYVLEYFPRGNLEMLTMRGSLPKEAIAEITAMVLKGLEGIHQNGWVHRDIKPENVCFRDDFTAALIDFDTALEGDFKPTTKEETKSIKEQSAEEKNRRYSVKEVQAMRKKSQQFVGTAYYISPEMLGSCTWSYCSDLWAVGCMVYQMATGTPPFFAESQFEIFRQIVKNKINLTKISDPVVRDFCEKTLIDDPTKRLGYLPAPSSTNYLKAVKDHPLFASVQWNSPNVELLKSVAPVEDKEYIKQMVGDSDMPFDEWVALKNKEKLLADVASDGEEPTAACASNDDDDDADDTMDIIDDTGEQVFDSFVFGNAQ